jgi:hypothetical protein
MLAKLPVILSVWFLLSLIITLLVGMAIYAFREVRAPGFAPPLAIETDWQPADADTEVAEEEEEELLVLAH